MHEKTAFLTLTYNNDSLPSHGTLVLADWQNFLKRVRNDVGKIRFFGCGEYGSLYDDSGDEIPHSLGRPHYHMAAFGYDWSEDAVFHKNSTHGDPLFTSPSLTKQWGKGHAYIGELTHKSAAYIARYVMKKQGGTQADAHYGRICLEPDCGLVHQLKKEFVTMSLKPGIGSTWFDKYHGDVYPSDEVISDGFPTPPPRFYDKLLKIKDPAMYETIKLKRAKEALLHPEDQTDARKKVREQVCKLTTNTLKRTSIK